MKVFSHDDFYQVYADDPAAAAGRMQAIVREIAPHVTFEILGRNVLALIQGMASG